MINSLLKEHPDIAKEWHPQKNKILTPSNVSSGSSKKVWWICSKGHEFEQRIRYHVTTKKCPICSGRKVSKETSLAVLFPEIAAEWHPTKNGTLTPYDVRPGSSKIVFWQCPINPDHVYKSNIHQRTHKKSLCPICQMKAVLHNNSIAKLYPELIAEWDFKKNNTIDPKNVTPGSVKKVWWICKNNHEHRFEATITDRVKGKSCQICYPPNHKPNVLPTLNIANPGLLKEWDYRKNKSLNPNTITSGSAKKVWWICKVCGHSWESSVVNRYRKGKGCPKCAGYVTTKEKSLAIMFPEIADEWSYEKNNDLTPENVSYGSGKKVWWICKNNNTHIWQAMIRDRTKKVPTTCPYCRQRKSILSIDFPFIANEWHPTKNGSLKPSDVTSKSNKKVWWLCSKNNNHEWEAEVKNRTILNSGCPICFKERADISTTIELIDSIVSSTEVYANYKSGIENIAKLLQIKIWNQSLKYSFRRMIYANIVTLMEAYLSDTFIKTVIKSHELQRKFIETNPRFQKEKIEISNIFSWFEKMEKNIKEELIDITYHNIWKIQNMYRDVLEIHFPDNLEKINDIILLRHDIVHRNGKTKEGKQIIVDIFDIKAAIDEVNRFILSIETQYNEKFSVDAL